MYVEPDVDLTAKPWGEVWGPPFVNEGRVILMRRKAQRVRFFDQQTGDQIGPEHRNVVPAIIWAMAEGWNDTTTPQWVQDEMRREIAANTTRKGAHK